MPHNPSMPEQIAQRVLGRVAALGGVNSAAQNGDLATAIGRVSEELSLVDRRVAEFVQAHHFRGVRGEKLRERVRQLPKDFPQPEDARPATGGNFTLKRSSGVDELACPPGSIRIANVRFPEVNYVNVDEALFEVGILQLTNVSFVCTTPGEPGTAGTGDVAMVMGSPSGAIIYARNFAGMLGHNAETDDEIIRRTERWLWSMAQSQLEAVISLTEVFRSQTDPTKIIGATPWTDIEHPGYSEVYLENGSAMQGFTRLANPRSGTIPVIPDGRRHLFTFDWPAATPPKLRITGSNGSTVGVYQINHGLWTAQEENGEMWIKRNSAGLGLTLEAGDTWETFGHYVYTGITVDVQRYYERYCAAMGTRIRARHGSPQAITISADAVVVEYPGLTKTKILDNTKVAIVAFVSRLKGGEPLKLFDLVPALQGKVKGLVNLIFDHGDLYAGGPNKKLVTSSALITLR